MVASMINYKERTESTKKERRSNDCLFALDVETTSIWHNCLRDETGRKVADEAIPILVDLFQSMDVGTTFFITGYFASKFPEAVKRIHQNGFEIGSHSLYHDKENGHDVTDLKTQISHLSASKDILENITGEQVLSFRAPALRINEHTAFALAETNYRIDSSVASQRFDFFFSIGSVNKLKWLFAPRLPYRTDHNSLVKRGDGPIIEVPLSAYIIPYLGTTMRIFPQITKVQHHLVHLENRINSKPVVFDFHPNELVDESLEVRTIYRRSGNVIKYLVQDYLRTKLKQKNLGSNALKLYRREMEFFKARNYNFVSLKEYCLSNGLLI